MTPLSDSPVWRELLHRAALEPRAPVLHGSCGALSAADLVAAVERTATALQRAGVGTLALRADNSPAWIVIDLACQQAAVRLVPLPMFFSPPQLAHVFASTGIDALAAPRPDWPGSPLSGIEKPAGKLAGVPFWRLSPGPALVPQGTTKITFTSGSTGTPKGVCLSADHPQQVARSLAQMIGLPGVRHLCVLPLATLLENVGGVYAPLLSQGSVVVPGLAQLGLHGSSRLDTAALTAAVDRHRPHSMILVPELLQALVLAVRHGWRPPSSLRFVAVGGARVSPSLIVTARRGGLPVYEGYGLSECASVVSLNTPGNDRPGSAGRPLPHLQVGMRDGELQVSGSSFLGYLGAPESWRPERVRTGDLGALDADGFVRVMGRRDSLIVTSFGRNLSPEWVEAELLASPLLGQAVLFGSGRPHCAALLWPGVPTTPDVAIADWVATVNARLPDYARIHAWHRLASPLDSADGLLTSNGRPRRDAIATRYAAQIAALYRPRQELCRQ